MIIQEESYCEYLEYKMKILKKNTKKHKEKEKKRLMKNTNSIIKRDKTLNCLLKKLDERTSTQPLKIEITDKLK